MERRLLLAIVLTFIVLTAYQWLMPTPQQRRLLPRQARTRQPHNRRRPAPVSRPSRRLPTLAACRSPESRHRRAQNHGGERPRPGGLLEPRRDVGRVGASELSRSRRQACRSVPHDVPPTQPRPFSLELEDASKSARVNSALFTTTPVRRSTRERRPSRCRSSMRMLRGFRCANSSASSRIHMS